MSSSESNRKIRQGKVVSNAADKTIVVSVDRRAPHKVYNKMVKITKKYYAHDEKNEANNDDIVRICECRPMSKTKRWRLLEIVERASLGTVNDELK